jgi:hypothetical protein
VEFYLRVTNRGELVAVEADNDGGEGVDFGEDDADTNGVGEEDNEEENHSDEEEPIHNFPDFTVGLDLYAIHDELAEIESDGEIEDERSLPYLDSADPLRNKVNS